MHAVNILLISGLWIHYRSAAWHAAKHTTVCDSQRSFNTCTLLSSMQALMHPSPSLQSTPCCWHCCRRLASAQRLKAAKMTYSARKQVCRRHCCSLLSQNDVRLPQRKAVQQSVPLPSTPCSLAVAPHVYSRAAHLLRQTQRLCCLCCKQVPTG